MAFKAEAYLTSCWSCFREFDALASVWCSHDPRLPSKTCPHCGKCFCAAGEKYRQEFWRRAPAPLLEELELLSRHTDRLGETLVRAGKLATPQLLHALLVQQRVGSSLDAVLIEEGMVAPDDVERARSESRTQPLSDTRGIRYSAQPVLESNDPLAVLQFLLELGARRGASDLRLEPRDNGLAVRYRIEDFTFRLDPIPRSFQDALLDEVFQVFGLDAGRAGYPQRGRCTQTLAGHEFDCVAQTLPTTRGTSVTVKLVDRASFVKDFATLGLPVEERLLLVDELRRSFGLVLVAAPHYEGASSTLYSLMDFLARAQRDVVSLEAPVLWRVEGAWQVEVPEGPAASHDTLRAALAARPDVLVLFSLPDAATARLAVELAASILVVAAVPALGAAHGLQLLLEQGVARHLLEGSLSLVMAQRLMRRVCDVCRSPASAPPDAVLAQHGVRPDERPWLGFHKGRGCPSCNRLGYRGRVAVFELLRRTPALREALRAGLPPDALEAAAQRDGMHGLRDRALAMVASGTTSFDEFVRLRL